VIRERHQIDEPGIPSSIGEQGRDRIERLVHQLDPVDDFNFRHFRMRHMVAELLRRSLAPGTEAPDFELHSAEGARVRLRDLRGRPVLLHLVSYTCPVTRGGVSTMAELHELYGDRVTFIEMLVRQAHPGERHGPYHSDDQKVAEARDYQAEEHIPWLVLTDTLDGETQRAYLGLAAAVYLIDRRGVVSFCGTWGQSPVLRATIDDLLDRDGVGAPAGKGLDRRPHLAAAIVAGQGGPLRGGRQVDRSGARVPRRQPPHGRRETGPSAPCPACFAHDAVAEEGARGVRRRPRRRRARAAARRTTEKHRATGSTRSSAEARRGCRRRGMA
jgi:hypothetical protein